MKKTATKRSVQSSDSTASRLTLTATVLLALSAAFFAIAIHQTYYNGLITSYPLFMLTAGLFFGFALIRDKKPRSIRSVGSRLRRAMAAARPASATIKRRQLRKAAA